MRVSTVSAGGAAGGLSANYWLDELRAGRCFSSGDMQAAVTAQFGHIQLLNPAASGVNAIVYGYAWNPATLQEAEFRRYDTALTTLVRAGVNLLIGAADGVCEVRKQTNAAILGTPVLQRMRFAAAYPIIFGLWLCEIGPGEGVLLAHTVVNIQVAGTYFWNEVPV